MLHPASILRGLGGSSKSRSSILEPGLHSDVLACFEDRDEPIASLADPDAQLAEVFGALDPQGEDAEVQMIRAVSTYLAFRRDEVADGDDDLLRLAARSGRATRPATS